MARIEPRLLKGFRDYLPEQMIARKRMMDTIVGVFERYGFSPLQTPALEYSEILLGKLGLDAERQLYRFTDNGGRDVCLRYDLTVPLARVAAQYGHLPLPFKRYQIAPVWRAEKPAKGRFREFFQCDVDIVGTASLLADAECLAVDAAVFRALGIQHLDIRINHRKVLTGFLEALLPDATGPAGNAVLRTIDKLLAMGEDAVRGLLETDNGLDDAAIDRVFRFLSISGGNDEKLARAEELIGSSETGCEGLAELRDVVARAADMGVPREQLRIDFHIARGLDYYTGCVFETFLPDLPGFGSMMSGGRYDRLISMFLGRDMPAVGISAGIDRLFSGMIELGRIHAPKTPTQVLVAPVGHDAVPPALRTASELRAAGIPTEVYLEEARLKKQLKYANQRGIQAVVILGEDELATGKATVKHMTTGKQEPMPLDDLPNHLGALLSRA